MINFSYQKKFIRYKYIRLALKSKKYDKLQNIGTSFIIYNNIVLKKLINLFIKKGKKHSLENLVFFSFFKLKKFLLTKGIVRFKFSGRFSKNFFGYLNQLKSRMLNKDYFLSKNAFYLLFSFSFLKIRLLERINSFNISSLSSFITNKETELHHLFKTSAYSKVNPTFFSFFYQKSNFVFFEEWLYFLQEKNFRSSFKKVFWILPLANNVFFKKPIFLELILKEKKIKFDKSKLSLNLRKSLTLSRKNQLFYIPDTFLNNQLYFYLTDRFEFTENKIKVFLSFLFFYYSSVQVKLPSFSFFSIIDKTRALTSLKGLFFNSYSLNTFFFFELDKFKNVFKKKSRVFLKNISQFRAYSVFNGYYDKKVDFNFFRSLLSEDFSDSLDENYLVDHRFISKQVQNHRQKYISNFYFIFKRVAYIFSSRINNEKAKKSQIYHILQRELKEVYPVNDILTSLRIRNSKVKSYFSFLFSLLNSFLSFSRGPKDFSNIPQGLDLFAQLPKEFIFIKSFLVKDNKVVFNIKHFFSYFLFSFFRIQSRLFSSFFKTDFFLLRFSKSKKAFPPKLSDNFYRNHKLFINELEVISLSSLSTFKSFLSLFTIFLFYQSSFFNLRGISISSYKKNTKFSVKKSIQKKSDFPSSLVKYRFRFNSENFFFIMNKTGIFYIVKKLQSKAKKKGAINSFKKSPLLVLKVYNDIYLVSIILDLLDFLSTDINYKLKKNQERSFFLSTINFKPLKDVKHSLNVTMAWLIKLIFKNKGTKIVDKVFTVFYRLFLGESKYYKRLIEFSNFKKIKSMTLLSKFKRIKKDSDFLVLNPVNLEFLDKKKTNFTW